MATAPEHHDRLFKALGDSTRRQILALLAEQRRPVVEIAARFPMSRPAISKHLRILREAGLVAERREGRRHLYGLEDDALDPVAAWVRSVVRGEAEAGAPDAALAPPAAEAAADEDRIGTRTAAAGEARDTPPAESEGDEEDWRSW